MEYSERVLSIAERLKQPPTPPTTAERLKQRQQEGQRSLPQLNRIYSKEELKRMNYTPIHPKTGIKIALAGMTLLTIGLAAEASLNPTVPTVSANPEPTRPALTATATAYKPPLDIIYPPSSPTAIAETAAAVNTPEIKKKKDLLSEAAHSFYAKAQAKRNERAKKDPDYLTRINPELNKNRINFLSLGIGKEGALTDSIQVISYDLTSGNLSMISLPRDLQSPEVLKAYGGDERNSRINQALTKGGIDLSQLAVENATGLSMDFVMVNRFEILTKIIDKIGGIEVDVDKDIDDNNYPALEGDGYDPFHITKGHHLLNGYDALRYSRSRYSTSDYDRSKRQQKVLEALIKKYAEEMKKNPLKAAGLIKDTLGIINEEVNSGKLKADFDIGDISGPIISLIPSLIGGARFEMPPTAHFTVDTSNFVVSASLPGIAITKIKGGNAHSGNPRQDYWGPLRPAVKEFLTR
ncbi:MAG: LCP family protein [Candidatus Roizmanbacteria bacterium]|nr:MAG: LCP family protein [Candidatus Roizmanbacteria bacterium]